MNNRDWGLGISTRYTSGFTGSARSRSVSAYAYADGGGTLFGTSTGAGSKVCNGTSEDGWRGAISFSPF